MFPTSSGLVIGRDRRRYDKHVVHPSYALVSQTSHGPILFAYCSVMWPIVRLTIWGTLYRHLMLGHLYVSFMSSSGLFTAHLHSAYPTHGNGALISTRASREHDIRRGTLQGEIDSRASDTSFVEAMFCHHPELLMDRPTAIKGIDGKWEAVVFPGKTRGSDSTLNGRAGGARRQQGREGWYGRVVYPVLTAKAKARVLYGCRTLRQSNA